MSARERGWLIPYLVHADEVFGVGRLAWWCEACADGALPARGIPQIEFRGSSDTRVRPDLVDLSATVAERGPFAGAPLSPDGARRHIEGLVDQMGGGWEALLYFIRWLSWGLGVSSGTEAPRAWGTSSSAEWDEMLTRLFHVQRLLAGEADVLGAILAERHGAGWNPNAFYPTPMEVCTCMAAMSFGDGAALADGRDGRLAAVCDPCVGTGRMLLAASNYSVNLYGADIDQTMVDSCAINMALFAPWAVYQPLGARDLLQRPRRSLAGDQRAVEGIDEQRQAAGHDALPSELVVLEGVTPAGDPLPDSGAVERIYNFNRHGQGELFSVPPKGAKP